MSIKYFASGDIHSFFDEWMHYLKLAGFERDNPDHRIIICGDLFDRGNKTLECFDFVKQLANECRLVYIRGNHEDLLRNCVEQLRRGDIKLNHFRNGTVLTISHLAGCNQFDLLLNLYDKKRFNEKTTELLEFIDKNSVDCFELNNYIFVHGWVPCDTYTNEGVYKLTLADIDTWKSKWSLARWLNGMYCWSQGAIPEGKTIVCGHFHTSYGHFRFHGHPEEFPDILDSKALESFKPFVEDGIVAIDGCTAYTRLVNVVVFTQHEDGSVEISNLE